MELGKVGSHAVFEHEAVVLLIREPRIRLVDEEPSTSSTQALSTGGRRRNRRLQQNEILAGLSRVEPDEIAQDPRIRSEAVPPPARRSSILAIVEDLSLSR